MRLVVQKAALRRFFLRSVTLCGLVTALVWGGGPSLAAGLGVPVALNTPETWGLGGAGLALLLVLGASALAQGRRSRPRVTAPRAFSRA